jgi:zinc and cadmium transporter
MGALSLVGAVTLLLPGKAVKRLLLPLVAFAAGSLVGGALFHMIPAALIAMPPMTALGWVALGFLVFLGLEQFLHWQHCHRAHAEPRAPVTYLVLLGDGLHNFLDGMSLAGVFLVDVRLGIAAWLATAAHEVPQELADFAVLVRGGWKTRTALFYNLLSGTTFLIGALVVYGASLHADVRWLVPFAAGTFIYIGASDLVPDINRASSFSTNLLSFAVFAAGLGALYALALSGHD